MIHLATMILLSLPAVAEKPVPLVPELAVFAVEYHDNGSSDSRLLWQAEQDGATGEWKLFLKDRDWWSSDSFPEWNGCRWVIVDDSRDVVILAEQVWWTFGDFDPSEISDGWAK